MVRERRVCCFGCGEAINAYDQHYHDPFETCGKPECDREARDAMREEREHAHEDLDDRMGW